MKKILSIALVGSMLLCSFVSGLVFADEPVKSNPPHTIAEKMPKKSRPTQSQKSSVSITEKALIFLIIVLPASFYLSVFAYGGFTLYSLFHDSLPPPFTMETVKTWCDNFPNDTLCECKKDWCNCYKCINGDIAYEFCK